MTMRLTGTLNEPADPPAPTPPPMRRAVYTPVISAVALELDSARAAHSNLTSAHEAYAVILEELDEFWDEVCKRRHKRNPEHMAEELLQVAAMALRAIEDLDLVGALMHGGD